MLAALNHPNMAQIHGLEESEGVRALVMELVPGPTLAEMIILSPDGGTLVFERSRTELPASIAAR